MDIGGNNGIGIGVVGDCSSSVVVLLPSDEMANDVGMVTVIGATAGTIDASEAGSAAPASGEPASVAGMAELATGVTTATGTTDAIVATSSMSESMPCAKSM